jgi:hypothetical protein
MLSFDYSFLFPFPISFFLDLPPNKTTLMVVSMHVTTTAIKEYLFTPV